MRQSDRMALVKCVRSSQTLTLDDSLIRWGRHTRLGLPLSIMSPQTGIICCKHTHKFMLISNIIPNPHCSLPHLKRKNQKVINPE